MEDGTNRTTIFTHIFANYDKNRINTKIKEEILLRGISVDKKYDLHLQSYPFEDLEGIVIPDSVTALYIEDGKLTSISGITLPPSLKIFDCSHNRISSLEGFVFPKHLVEFIARDNKITSIDSIIFPDTLRVLILTDNSITTITNMTFPALEILSFTYTRGPIMLVNPKFNSVLNKYFTITLEDDILSNLTKYYTRDQLIFLYLNLTQDIFGILKVPEMIDTISTNLSLI